MAGRIDATHRCPYADGAVTTFGYNGAHRVISVLDPAQQSASVRHPMTMVYDMVGVGHVPDRPAGAGSPRLRTPVPRSARNRRPRPRPTLLATSTRTPTSAA
mgnify:CR=1 FL=1